MSVSETTVSSVLIREEGGIQASMYYTSRAFKLVEERYLRAKKMVFTLVVMTWWLRPYFQAHTIWVLIDQLLKTILHKPETFGRLVKWSVELSEFDIKYQPWRAIKGQAVMDFIVEYTHAPGVGSEAQEE